MTKVGETAIYDPPREFSGNKVHACTKHTRTLKTKELTFTMLATCELLASSTLQPLSCFAQ